MSSLVLVTVMSPLLAAAVPLDSKLDAYVQARVAEFDTIPEERQKQLAKISKFVRDTRAAGRPVRLTFICTHKLPAQPSLADLGQGRRCALWHRSRNLLRRNRSDRVQPPRRGNPAAGWLRDRRNRVTRKNPRYQVKYSDKAEPLVCFSKKYDESPQSVRRLLRRDDLLRRRQEVSGRLGATVRIPVPYEDPKVSDNTDKEAATYDERSRQIAREMLYAMSLVDAK